MSSVLADAPDGPRRRRRIDRTPAAGEAPITLMSIEVEYFGDLSRRQKRALCEDVIRRTELRLPNLLRLSDVTYREGRGRVCVLLPDTSPDDAEIVVSRVRRAMEFELLPTKATVSITLSEAGDQSPPA